MFRALAEDADFEYTMIDGTIVKVHRHGQGAKGMKAVHKRSSGSFVALNLRSIKVRRSGTLAAA
jgi:hypothetical protein